MFVVIMAVIIDEIITDPGAPAVHPAAPRDPVPASDSSAARMEQVRTELQREAQRRARLWTD